MTGGDGPPPRRRRRWFSWTVAVLLAVWAVVRVFGLEFWSFPTQLMTVTPIGVGIAAVAGGIMLLRNRRAAIVAFAACVAMAAVVVPRAFGEPSTAAGAPLKVLTINLFGRGDADTVVELVKRFDPDVLTALELTPREVERLRVAGLEQLLPYNVLEAEFGATGSGLYGKHPLTKIEGMFTPIGHNMPAARLDLPSGSVEVVAVHPNPPLGRMEAEWNASLKALPSPSPQVIRVLAGDFNASLDHRAFRDLLDRGYVDAAEQVGKALVPTWPNGRKMPPIITIDHVLADERAGVKRVEVLDVPNTDHRAVFAELSLPR